VRIVVPLVWILTALFLQGSALNQILPFRLDLMLGFSIVWAALAGPAPGALTGFFGGAALGWVAGGGWIRPAVRFLIGYGIGALKPVLYTRQSVLLPLVAIATVLEETIASLVWLLSGHLAPIEALPRTLSWLVPGNVLLVWPLLGLIKLTFEFQRDRWVERSERLV